MAVKSHGVSSLPLVRGDAWGQLKNDEARFFS